MKIKLTLEKLQEEAKAKINKQIIPGSRKAALIYERKIYEVEKIHD